MNRRARFPSGVIAAAFAAAIHLAAASFASAAETTPEMPREIIESLRSRVESWQVESIWPRVESALSASHRDPGLLEVASLVAFYRGDYSESLRLMKKALEIGGENESRKAFARFTEDTLKVLSGYRRHETPHFIIHLDERQDGILLGYLAE
ncbi:MAG: hypothetical protein C4530_22775, partial [Desulfobacteraceae bacterium]